MKKIIGIVLGMSIFVSILSAIGIKSDNLSLTYASTDVLSEATATTTIPTTIEPPVSTVAPATTVQTTNQPDFVPTPDDGVYSISISNKKISMGIKDRVKINICEVNDNNNIIRDSKMIDEVINNGEVCFKSRNKKVATVSKNGVIKAKSEGKVIVSVAYGDRIPGSGRHNVEVKVIGNTFKTKEVRLKRGQRKVLKATLGKEKQIKFRVCDKNIIRVVKKQEKSIVVKGVKKGKTFVKAMAGGKKAKCKVIVK